MKQKSISELRRGDVLPSGRSIAFIGKVDGRWMIIVNGNNGLHQFSSALIDFVEIAGLSVVSYALS